MTRRKLFLLFFVSNQLMAQIPTNFATGTIQDSGEISMYSSSLDNLVNSQQGEFIANTISNDLVGEASKNYEKCNDPLASEDPDCLMSSTLLGMMELTDQSAVSFSEQAKVAQSNVCVFTSLACGAKIPNAYSSLSPKPALTSEELEKLIEELNGKGFSIQPKTGIVKIQGVSVINPSSPESLKKNLGESQARQLMTVLQSLEKRAVQLASKLSKPQVVKKLGLKEFLVSTHSAQKNIQNENRSHSTLINEVKRNEQTLEKMATSYQGEPVGIGPSSLFKIVKKRYGIKINQKSFLPTH